MSHEIRTRVLTEQGEWKEADKPAERLPKTRRFMLVDVQQSPTTGRGVTIAEGVCWTDGSVAVHRRADRHANGRRVWKLLSRHRMRNLAQRTTIYDSIEDVIAANTAELTWVD